MKSVILFVTLVTSTAAFAKGQVFCRNDSGKIINVLSADGLDCQSALYDGSACFTGDSREAAKILNSDEVHSLFDGTDGEYIKGAKVKDSNTITYTAMDEANEWSNDVSMKRCLGSFFRN